MYTYTYICIYIYIYIYVYVFIYMYTHTHVPTYVYVGIGGARDGASAGANVNRYKTKGNKQRDETIQQIAKKLKLDPHALLEHNKEKLATLGNNTGCPVFDNQCIYAHIYIY